MGPSNHFYSHMDPVWSLLIVGTGFIPWVELPIQMRFCPVFMSGVGLPDIQEFPQVDELSTDPWELGRHMDNRWSQALAACRRDFLFVSHRRRQLFLP